MACTEALRTQSYFDGELEVAAAAEVERHIEQCSICTALIRELRKGRGAIRENLPDFRAPAALRTQLPGMLDREAAVPRRPWSITPFWIGAGGGAGFTAVAAVLAIFVLPSLFPTSLLDDVLNAHVRSLESGHLIQVESTDKHTVKPWFAGRVDVSPAVADFTVQGFQLTGGRVDQWARQKAAVTVYRHGAHVINVFSWADSARALPQDATRHGYHLAFWKAGDVDYCAISDTGWEELRGLENLLQRLSAAGNK
jgi:anti-sigma factor RsiW